MPVPKERQAGVRVCVGRAKRRSLEGNSALCHGKISTGQVPQLESKEAAVSSASALGLELAVEWTT